MDWQIPTNSLDLFVRSVEIASFLPGRIRLYSQKLINNPKAAEELRAKLAAFPELSHIDVNTVTGSLLITYDPAVLARNPKLKKAENYIKAHAKR